MVIQMKKMISLIIIGALLTLAACTQTVEQSSAVDAPDTATVELTGIRFVPDTVTIKRGGTITFVNKDLAPHTVTAKEFDSGDMKKGDTFSQTFTKTGSTSIICKYHPGMTLKVIVK